MSEYITTYTGRRFHYDNINADSIHIEDVLRALPRINRFVGHSSRRYSVGEHTYIGLVMAEKLGYTPLQKLQWFIHDFTEAYVGDCNSPLKKLLPKFVEIEAQVEQAILDHLGLKPLTEEEFKLVKRIDMTMLVLEMRDLTLHTHEDFVNDYTYTDILFDDDFVISQNPVDDNDLTNILTALFNYLMEEVKNEEV